MGHSREVGAILIRLWDGTRHLLTDSPRDGFLVTVENQSHSERQQSYRPGPEIVVPVTVYDGPGTCYSVIVSGRGYSDSGYYPVQPKAGETVIVDLMLIPEKFNLHFTTNGWADLNRKYPRIATRLAAGFASADLARANYDHVMQTAPRSLASFFNITTAMDQIRLDNGTALDYMVKIIWDEPEQRAFAQDRFFAYARLALAHDTEDMARRGLFGPECLLWLFHPGARIRFKQAQFGEANVQLTFHEQKDGLVVVEPEIDYYKDETAHAIFQAIPDRLHQNLTDPEQAYVLHWVGSRIAGLDYDPPYVISAVT
jgi:hypothetical protein